MHPKLHFPSALRYSEDLDYVRSTHTGIFTLDISSQLGTAFDVIRNMFDGNSNVRIVGVWDHGLVSDEPIRFIIARSLVQAS